MSDTETIAIYDSQVKKYAELVSTEKAGTILKEFMKAIPKDGYVLDLGCGPGNSSAFLKNQGFRVDPVDASQEMVNHANETYDINARRASFDELSAIETYDAVWANFSLLHAPIEDFPKHLTAIKSALLPNGIFHIGMKLGSGMIRDSIGRMYSYYSEEELTEHLTKSGFEILETTFGEEPGLSGEMAKWVTILARKQNKL